MGNENLLCQGNTDGQEHPKSSFSRLAFHLFLVLTVLGCAQLGDLSTSATAFTPRERVSIYGLQTTGKSVRQQVIAFTLPVDSADFKILQDFQNARGASEIAMVQRCLVVHRSKITLHWTSQTGPDNYDFPDITTLKARGFSLLQQLPRGSQDLGGSAKDYTKAKEICSSIPAAPLSQLFDEVDAKRGLTTLWRGDLQAIDSRVLIGTALLRWRTCLEPSGLQFDSLGSWFNSVNDAVAKLVNRSRFRDALHLQVRDGRLFGRCFAPVEAMRESERRQARILFEKSHRTQLANLEAQAVRELLSTAALLSQGSH
jgi:hypothetical protein